ncbi:hypothetical protein Poly41_54910 [Novipirellula artificiosorum]|uniref:Uncharacterized protein n=1 Tax=Novipirellula artificiosorum TaxID=2528016 RepID=A0A5C6D5T0_9BACT|nr:hypothetical protein Poly41_54910 [Novipirellula artificiosorum]
MPGKKGQAEESFYLPIWLFRRTLWVIEYRQAVLRGMAGQKEIGMRMMPYGAKSFATIGTAPLYGVWLCCGATSQGITESGRDEIIAWPRANMRVWPGVICLSSKWTDGKSTLSAL